jgi:hypothetical protein
MMIHLHHLLLIVFVFGDDDHDDTGTVKWNIGTVGTIRILQIHFHPDLDVHVHVDVDVELEGWFELQHSKRSFSHCC